ncbi:hypothetical protein [Pararhizobium sp. DWP3-4]|uniref:hypothetical protein n=1 Tax=Pararhizobium sp. DWP3-4 TaxID=2804565 RepID=UPI003CF75C8A
MSWEAVSAVANVVMGATAVGATFYGFRQYKHSVEIQENDSLFSMTERMASANKAIREAGDDQAALEQAVKEIINILEVFCFMLHKRQLSHGVNEFVSDLVNSDLKELIRLDAVVEIIRESSKRNPNAARYIKLQLERVLGIDETREVLLANF